MPDSPVYVIDLLFQDIRHAIAAYVIPHAEGAVMVECGPASTFPALEAGLETHGLRLKDITDLFVTHIHLDHAGAVGWLAREGTRVHVHHVGAPHLIDPEKLLASAGRIYGDLMDRLWGKFLPVPADQVVPLYDGNQVVVANLTLTALDTPGHANHHHAYRFEDLIFSGDVGGIRLPDLPDLPGQGDLPERPDIQLPLPPPELHLARWAESLARLGELAGVKFIAPTHFGMYSDWSRHLTGVEVALAAVGAWLDGATQDLPEREVFQERYLAWVEARSLERGDDERTRHHLDMVNPAVMNVQGLYRYWQKSLNG